MSIACAGIGVGAGIRIAVGQSYLLCHGPVCVTPAWIAIDDIDREIQRFERAVADASRQLREVRQQIPENTPSEIADFIDTHLLMVEDKAISSGAVSLIRESRTSAEWALQQHRDALLNVFDRMEDKYLQTRRDDLDHVVNRILKALLAQQDAQLEELQGQIVLAEDLTPADVILMKNQGAAGFITETGSPMSHTAILARSLGIPAIVGAHGATRCLRHGELLIIDTNNGMVLADCDQRIIDHYEDRREYDRSRADLLRRESATPAVTADGRRVQLLANIELSEDYRAALLNGADGIGLYRTEFLYMNRDRPPTEQEHFDNYMDVLRGMRGKPVTIRTLDLGADKQAGTTISGSGNPALGLRAIRLCLKEPELFRPQVRAILRTSAHGPVRLMLPMLTNLWEVSQARRIVNQCKQELEMRGDPFDPDLPIGGMIEVPAAALTARSFAAELDFLSIGTNDLIQYTLAIDRVDDEVNYLYDPAHPAVFKLLHETINAANEAGIPISMCGEMAGDPRFIALLLGLGLAEFSMEPSAILNIKQLLRKQDTASLIAQARSFMAELDTADPGTLLEQWLVQIDT